jgi:hypothetical protein
MKAVVIACKNITQDADTFENDSPAFDRLSEEDIDYLEDLKGRMSEQLTSLMTSCKSFAGGNSSTVTTLEDLAVKLTSTISDLLRHLKSIEEQGHDNINRNHGIDYNIDELKVF